MLTGMNTDREDHPAPPPGESPSAEPKVEAGDAHESPASLESEPSRESQTTFEPDEPQDPATTLSPGVRRLIRQYDLDVTGIHGSGPAGRIRVGDVIALLGGRTEPAQARMNDPAQTLPVVDEPFDEPGSDTPYKTAASAPSLGAVAARAVSGPIPTSSVFECDLSRVLAHRKQQREHNAEILLTSYYLVACSEALKLVPELVPGTNGGPLGVHLGVILSSAEGYSRSVVVDAADRSVLASIDDRLQAFDRALRAVDAPGDLTVARLLLHHHGSSGSLIATPTPIGEGHTASLGLGRVRRQIVVRTHDGEEAPKIAALCYVTLSFFPDRLELPRANRFLAQFVRVLEQWPD